jgi:hypothetical protein
MDGFDEQHALGEPVGVVVGKLDVFVRGEHSDSVGQVLGGGDVLGVLGRRRARMASTGTRRVGGLNRRGATTAPSTGSLNNRAATSVTTSR